MNKSLLKSYISAQVLEVSSLQFRANVYYLVLEPLRRGTFDGNGCCIISLDEGAPAFNLQLICPWSRGSRESGHDRSSLLWDEIKVASQDAAIDRRIVDEPSCTSALKNLNSYACISTDSSCDGQDYFYGYPFSYVIMVMKAILTPPIAAHLLEVQYHHSSVFIGKRVNFRELQL